MLGEAADWEGKVKLVRGARLLTSPRLRGEVGTLRSAFRVRGYRHQLTHARGNDPHPALSPQERGEGEESYTDAVVTPPSTTMVWPVMKVEASEAR